MCVCVDRERQEEKVSRFRERYIQLKLRLTVFDSTISHTISSISITFIVPLLSSGVSIYSLHGLYLLLYCFYSNVTIILKQSLLTLELGVSPSKTNKSNKKLAR